MIFSRGVRTKANRACQYTVSASHSAEFRKSKKSNWKTVGAPAPSSAEQLAADEILASAAAEQTARREAEDAEDADGVNGAIAEKNNEPRMASGARAGLQTAAQVSEATAERNAEERRQFEMLGVGPSGMASAAAAAELAHETIYRDASGRIINIAMKRAEARKAAEEEERKKRAEVDARKGDVQQAERGQRKAQLEDAKYMTVARHADDKEMNEQLRERERWDDPAAGFLTKKKKEKKSITGKPVYQGAAPPNRYGIKPGHRWDGVDRGNGFEKQYFKAMNKRRDEENLQYAWQMDE